jgi:iron complex outermembrane recepter protein
MLITCSARRALGLLLFCLASVGTSTRMNAQPARGTVVGRITSAEDGAPIPGASIALLGRPIGALSRGDGTYRFVAPPGQYQLVVRLIGFANETRPVTVVSGQTLTVNVALKRAAATLAAIAIVGSRREERTVTTASVPIDVITAEQIKQTGRTETAQILQMLVPSLNFPRSSIAGGVDGQRPFTLRGMNPDQVLVLINGKRRHIGAVVAVNNSVGRGSSGTDLNAIPAASIERIEVLRDGAAAQYGSDAIAGVVNIILKQNAPAQFSSTLGRVTSTVSQLNATIGQVRFNDGGVVQLDGTKSWALGNNGYLNISSEYRDRGLTNRSAPDLRQQFFNDDSVGRVAPERLSLARNNAWYGDAALKEGGALFNAAYTFAGGVQLYSFGGMTRRQSTAFGFPRRPSERTVVRALYPNGFLPQIWGLSTDGSGAAGAKGIVGGWNWDASANYGGNRFRFDVKNSNNPTLGLQSPTEFYAGELEAKQLTMNIDFSKPINVGLPQPLNVAFGVEARRDRYRIFEGDPTSYTDGGVRVLDGPEAGQPTVSGSQLFYGFRPVDAKATDNAQRRSSALYLDLELTPLRRVTIGAAGRRESFSDFGDATIGKVTGRVDLGKGAAFRAAYNTGFRAPTLGQAFYRATASNVLIIGGVPTPNEALTLSVDEPAARALGATPLRAEKSRNVSAGVTYAPSGNFSATVDWFRIQVNDRIVLSENFTGAGVRALLAANGVTGLDIRPRFFTNAVDTRTTGVDAVIRYLVELSDKRTMNMTIGYNNNFVRLLRVSAPPPELTAVGQTQLFGRVERSRLVESQPRNSFRGSATYTQGKTTVQVQQACFGSVTSRPNLSTVVPTGRDPLSVRDPQDQTFGGRWITDVSATYQVDKKLSVTLGADNLFDVYPDRLSVNNPENFGGTRLFGPFIPFGANGRFVFMRAAYTP